MNQYPWRERAQIVDAVSVVTDAWHTKARVRPSGGTVVLDVRRPMRLTPGEARTLAADLADAAELAEVELQKHEGERERERARKENVAC